MAKIGYLDNFLSGTTTALQHHLFLGHRKHLSYERQQLAVSLTSLGKGLDCDLQIAVVDV